MVTVLKKGSYFGEIGLLRNCRRTATVSALSETCDLFVLSKAPTCPCLHFYLHSCMAEIILLAQPQHNCGCCARRAIRQRC